MSDFWFNLDTKAVEEGVPSNTKTVMGPYPTYEAAAAALEHAAENTQRWDAEEEED